VVLENISVNIDQNTIFSKRNTIL